MHQQLAATLGLVIERVRIVVFRDVGADEPDFVLVDAAIGFIERESAGAKALDFTANENDAALERVEHQIVMPGLAVIRDNPLVLVLARLALLRLGGFVGFLRVFSL